jgi:hypothetical protein
VIRKDVARLAVVILAWILPQAGVALAQNPRTQQDRPQSPQTQTPPQENNEDLRTYSGEISSSSGKYVLEGASPRGPYLLDDQKSAKKYEGKNVLVTGLLDRSSNTIHVQKIQEAAPA